MTQVLEYPWNGVAVDGGMPAASVPGFVAARNVRRLRVLLDPRAVMPVGTSSIPGGVQTQLTGLANAASSAGCKVEWALLGCTEPTSASASRRPTVAWLTTFWTQVNTLLGGHAATAGFALLTSPTVAELSQANGDPDVAVAAWANMSWPVGENPALNAGPWLEACTGKVVANLRAAGCTARLVLPLIYDTTMTAKVASGHPNGPWVNDSGAWYEATVSPMGPDGVHVSKGYAGYLADAQAVDDLYRPSWSESAYFTQTPGYRSVIDALDLVPPEQQPIPDANEVIPPLPVTGLTGSPLDGGALLSWTAPADFGSGTFATYRVTAGTVVWETPLTAVEVALNNGVQALLSVVVVTDDAESPAVSVTVTPSLSSPEPSGPWLPPAGQEADTEQPVPQPLMFAFPAARNFRPANYMLSPDEVPEGL